MAPALSSLGVQIALIAIIIGLVLALIAVVAYLISHCARLAQDEENKPLLSKTMCTAATPTSNNAAHVSRTIDGTVDKGTNTDSTIKQRAWYDGLTTYGTPQQAGMDDQDLASTIRRKTSTSILTAAAAAKVFKSTPDSSAALTEPSDSAKDLQPESSQYQNENVEDIEEAASTCKSSGDLKPSDIFKPTSVDDEEANPWVTDLVRPTKGLIEAMKAKLNGDMSTNSGDEDQTIKARAHNDLRRHSILYTTPDVANEASEPDAHAAGGQNDSKYTKLSRSAPPGAFPVSPKEQSNSKSQMQTQNDKENAATKRKSKTKSSKLPRHRRQASKSEPNQDTATEAKLGVYEAHQAHDANSTADVVDSGGPTKVSKRQSSAPNGSRILSGSSSHSQGKSQRRRKNVKNSLGGFQQRSTIGQYTGGETDEIAA